MKLPSSYKALDIETTGLNVNSARIIQISIITVIDGAISDTYNEYVNPGSTKIQPNAEKIHGITKEDLKDRPHWIDIAWDVFSRLDNGLPIITFNGAAFDIPIVRAEFHRSDIPDPRIYEHHDVMHMAKERLSLPSYSQQAVAAKLAIPERRRHNAKEDALELIDVFEALKLTPTTTPLDAHVDKSKYAREIQAHSSACMEAPVGAQNALMLLTPHIPRIAAACGRASMLDCENEDEYNKTIEAEIFLKKLKSTLTKTRANNLRDLKTTIKHIEQTWREHALNPINNALDHIKMVRQPYLRKQHEAKLEARRQAEEAARLAAISIQHKKEREGLNKEQAKEFAETVQHEMLNDAKESISSMNKAITKFGSGWAKTEYTINIIDRPSVPKHLWSPDVKLILKQVEDNPQAPIAGVEIITNFKHSTRSK